ncbi:MAG: hypothetical protein ACHQ4H_09005, partial [Ktedonobacterales bacterium]
MQQLLDLLLDAFGGTEPGEGGHLAYPPPLTRIAKGALAGTIATIPMTVTMLLIFRLLPRSKRYPIEPRLLTRQVDERVLGHQLNPAAQLVLTMLAHFVYGAVVGTVAGPFARRLRLPAPLAGMVAGLGVWALSYGVALPSIGVLRPASERPPSRRLLLIAAHLVWGATLGWL